MYIFDNTPCLGILLTTIFQSSSVLTAILGNKGFGDSAAQLSFLLWCNYARRYIIYVVMPENGHFVKNGLFSYLF